VNLCSRSSPYSLNCHVGVMPVFRMLCRITQSSDAHRTESVSVMDHEQTMCHVIFADRATLVVLSFAAQQTSLAPNCVKSQMKLTEILSSQSNVTIASSSTPLQSNPIQSNVIWRAQVDPLCSHLKRQLHKWYRPGNTVNSLHASRLRTDKCRQSCERTQPWA